MQQRRITRLFVRMKNSGITQEALAARIGATRKAVNRVASGLEEPNTEMREKLCRVFACGYELFEPVPLEEGPEEVSRKTREYRKVMKRLHHFSEQVKNVEQSIRGLGTEIAALQKRI